MIGLIKLTGIDNQPFFLNPLNITLFTKSTPDFCRAICGNSDACCEGATTLLIGSLPMQFKDTPQEIIGALIRLRDNQHQVALDLLKKRNREDWQGDEDDTEEDD